MVYPKPLVNTCRFQLPTSLNWWVDRISGCHQQISNLDSRRVASLEAMTRLMPSSAAGVAASPAWLDLKSSSAVKQIRGFNTAKQRKYTNPDKNHKSSCFLWLKKHLYFRQTWETGKKKEFFDRNSHNIYAKKDSYCYQHYHYHHYIYNCTYTSILHPSKQRAHTPEKAQRAIIGVIVIIFSDRGPNTLSYLRVGPVRGAIQYDDGVTCFQKQLSNVKPCKAWHSQGA